MSERERQARRLFLALWPDEMQRAQMEVALRSVVASLRCRPVPRENLHVTLVFLGSVPVARLDTLHALLSEVAQQARLASPLCFEFDRLEYWRKADVLCVTASPSQAAGQLAAQFRNRLVAGGFCEDAMPFRPHVTCARKIRGRIADRAIDAVRWSFDAAVLVASHTGAAGPTYSIERRWPLCGEHAENT